MKIVSGGQTGVDRAALDCAIELGLEHGGWCPRGRVAEDGRIAERYALQETVSAEYAVRTERNVADSEGTLILCLGTPAGGTALTAALARRHGRPLLLVDLAAPQPIADVRQWIEQHAIGILNVAGPRESQSPGIGAQAKAYLRAVFESWPAN